jgi:hypothetical protein
MRKISSSTEIQSWKVRQTGYAKKAQLKFNSHLNDSLQKLFYNEVTPALSDRR